MRPGHKRALDAIADKVLSYQPKPKSESAKKRARRAKKAKRKAKKKAGD